MHTQDLEKIKEAEEEARVFGSVIRKKTYKGDVEIEMRDSQLKVPCIVWCFLLSYVVSTSCCDVQCKCMHFLS